MTSTEAGLEYDHRCFACGAHNERGLRLSFRFEGDEYLCEFEPEPWVQGWVGMTHGGIICTLLDEVMNRLVFERGGWAVTAELNVRFRRPVPTGTRVVVRSRLRGRRKRLYEAEAEVVLPDGEIAASATGKFLEVPGAAEQAAGGAAGGDRDAV